MGCLFSYPCLQALRGYGETPKDPVGQNLTAAAVQPEEEKAEVEKPPPTTLNRRKSVSAEAYNPETDEDGGEAKVVHPKSDIQRQRLADVVKNILLFRSLDQEQMQEVLDAMFEKAVQPGEHIIDQGDDGDNFYVIDSGTYDIFVDVDGKPKNVGNYDNAGFFGELALMYNMPRAATIIASSCGTIWALDRTTFRRIVLKTAFQKRKKYETLLESVPLLKSLDLYERMNVADALQSKTFEDGEQIIKQGDAAQMMYFVESGEVRIAMTNKEREDDGSDISDLQEAESCRLSLAENDPSQGEKDVTVVEKGGYFGELALITHQPRAASAYAKGQVKCALLDVEAFERIMGPCMEVLKRNITEYEAQLGQIFGTAV
ncbi:cAMP-dependent protein kinase type II-beta regulatory subunit-like isoform X2 [Babylonia areolata]